MLEYLVGRLAEALTKGDVFELFGLLEQRYKSVSKICKRIGIERKTFYHWKEAKQINAETKLKALQAALEEHPIATLEFLARKSRSMTKDILTHLMILLRQEILSEEDPEKIAELVKEAESIINEYSMPIIEYLRHETNDLIEAVHSRGHFFSYELKIKPTPLPVEEKTKELLKLSPSPDRGASSYPITAPLPTITASTISISLPSVTSRFGGT